MFWHLVGTETICDNDNLARGLRRHMTIRPFVNALMQIGTAQQTYLALPGCGKCDRNQCAITCHVQLLRRVLAGSGTALRLLPVVQGFIPRTYTRAVVASPTRDAQPLDGAFLADAGWGDARLTQVWVGTKTTLRVVAVLRAGADGPDLRARLFAHGWVTVGWASTLLAKRPAAAQLAVPPLVIGGTAYRHDPYLLLPVRSGPRTDATNHAGAGIMPVLPARPLAARAPAEALATAHAEPIESVGAELLIEQVTALATTFVHEEEPTPTAIEEMELPALAVEEEPALVIEELTEEPALAVEDEPVRVVEELTQELPALVVAEPVPAAIEELPALAVEAQPAPAAVPLAAQILAVREEQTATPTAQPALPLPAELCIEKLPSQELPALVVAEPGPPAIEEQSVVIAEPAEPAAPVLPWPDGPGNGKGRMYAADLGAFFTKLLAPGSSYHSAQEPGLSRRRVQPFVPDHLSEHGRTILVWLDTAGLLVPPANPHYPWARPRRLTTEDLAEIAARLALVSFPTESDLVMAKKQGM